MSMDARASQTKRLYREIKELEEALAEARYALLCYADADANAAYLHDGGLRSEPYESIAETLAVIDAALAVSGHVHSVRQLRDEDGTS